MITTCILTRDSGEFVKRALECVSSGEIVVLDHGSTDDTIDIVNLYTDKIMFIPREQEIDFAWARNSLAWKATSNIVFMLDADEFVNPLFLDMLKINIKSLVAGGATLKLAESYSPGMCDPTMIGIDKLRVYDRRYAIWKGRVHESLSFSGKGKVINTSFYLWHRSFKQSPEALWRKILFYNKTMGREDPKFSDKSFWEETYANIYKRQVEAPRQIERSFCLSFFEKSPWKTDNVEGGI